MYGLVRRNIPDMYAFTACLWLKPAESGIGTPFSYAVPEQPNELVLLQGIHNPAELLINDKVRPTTAGFLKSGPGGPLPLQSLALTRVKDTWARLLRSSELLQNV